MRNFIVTLIHLLTCSVVVYGQHIAFENLTVDNGLSQNSVLAITQDSRGFMWYGTKNGLNKYNTRDFKIYKSNPKDARSISSDYITALLVGAHQELWIGTIDGLNKYDPETDSFERVKLTFAGTETQNIGSIYEDHQKNIWVWSSTGLYRLRDLPKAKFEKIPLPGNVLGISGANFRIIYQDHEDIYWIGTSAGLTKMQIDQHKIICKLYNHQDSKSNTISDSYVTAIAEDANYNLWIGTSHKGLNLFYKRTEAFVKFTSNNNANGLVNNNVRVIYPDKAGNIWIGTQGGLSVLNGNTKQFTSYKNDPEDKNSLSQNSIYSIFIDKANTVWIGTYWGGISMLSNYNASFQSTNYHTKINNKVVSAVVENASHNLWIGTEGGGLSYLDRKKNSVTTYQNRADDPFTIGSDLIKTVYIDKSQNVWVGTHGGGLNLFRPATHGFRRYLYTDNDPITQSSEVLSVLEDSKKNYWVGTKDGLLLFKENHGNLIEAPIPRSIKIDKSPIKLLMEDYQKNIWIATTHGLYKFDPGNNNTNIFNTNDGLKSNDINCIYQDRLNNIWVGSYYGGISKFEASQKRFINYSEKEGLANDNVMSILQDNNNNLWIGTGDGLSRFSMINKTFKNYGKSDGLSVNTFNINSCYNTNTGEMFFGGFNGLVSFFPSKIIDNDTHPPVVITSLKLFNKPIGINQSDKLLSKDISLTKNIVFSYAQNVFTIDFAALNYIKSAKNKYSYKMDGFDPDWVHTNIPSAAYTNLPPGSYTFLATGSNNDGVWGTAAVLQIRVLPPFWKTVWAYMLYVLLGLGITFLIARFFILRSLLKRDKELTQLKLNFFTNISHEIRTHLSLIIGPIEKLIVFGQLHTENTTQLKIVKKNSDSLLHLVNELMDFRKAETGNLRLHVSQGNIVSFLYDIYSSFSETSAARNITIEFRSVADEIILYFDKEQIEKVFYNLISNAFKFTTSDGYIEVIIEDNKDHVAITVADNGKGIAPQNLENLFDNYFQENDSNTQNTGYGIGLALSKSIISLHHGTIVVDSKLSPSGNRTSFKVSLLKGASHFNATELKEGSLNYIPEPVNFVNKAESQNIESKHPINTVRNIKETVLLVEDNSDIRLFIRDSLERFFEVIECNNGLSGWELSQVIIPDIIISDVMMPEMDGFTFCNKVKTSEKTSHIPVILLTANTSGINYVNGLKMGADIYLTKPFNIEALLLQIENLLKARERIRNSFSQQLKANYNGTGFIPVSYLDNDEQAKALLNEFDGEFLGKITKIIEDNIDKVEFGVPQLAKDIGMSQPVLYKKLDAITGLSVNDFIKSIKMSNAAKLLQSKLYTVYQVSYMVGFSDKKYFSREFKKVYGKTPSEFVE